MRNLVNGRHAGVFNLDKVPLRAGLPLRQLSGYESFEGYVEPVSYSCSRALTGTQFGSRRMDSQGLRRCQRGFQGRR